MKSILITLLIFISWQIVSAQNPPQAVSKQDAITKVDNYTVQYLIIFNEKDEILMLKNKAGWHTLAMRSNES